MKKRIDEALEVLKLEFKNSKRVIWSMSREPALYKFFESIIGHMEFLYNCLSDIYDEAEKKEAKEKEENEVEVINISKEVQNVLEKEKKGKRKKKSKV